MIQIFWRICENEVKQNVFNIDEKSDKSNKRDRVQKITIGITDSIHSNFETYTNLWLHINSKFAYLFTITEIIHLIMCRVK